MPFLKLAWKTLARLAAMAVAVPTTAIHRLTCGARASSACERTRTYTPAATMVAAWISALIGVGPAIAFGSQKYSGPWADLAAAATNSSSANHSGQPGEPAHAPWPSV